MSDTEDTPKREARQPITPEVIEQTNRALEEAKGSATLAAKILGEEPTRIHSIIRNTPVLKARWGQGEQAAVDVVDRAPLPQVVPTKQEQLAASLTGQEKRLDKSLSKLGFSASEVRAISEVEEFAGAHFQDTLKILHGGMVKSSIRLMLLAEHIYATYLTDEDADPKETNRWWDRYFTLQQHLRDTNDAANRAALTQAMVRLKQNEATNGKGPGKPGFGPTVNVTPPRDV
jgi:hypothetical protein